MRIVSLLPSATEIVCELGLIDELVGISRDCDWPPEVRNKPVLSQATVSSDMTSREIDQMIRELVHNGLSVYHVDAGKLRELKPDLILTQELCEVCAPSFREVVQAAKILDVEPRIVSLEPTCIDEILETVRLVGELTKREAQAEKLIAKLRKRIARVRQAAEHAEEHPRVLALEWLEPLFIAGHWVPEMIELAGGESLSLPGEPSYELDWNDIEHFDPEILVLMPCGFTPQHTMQESDLLVSYENWEELRAVKNEQVYIVHGSFYFNRPGPRIVIGLEILARLIHPEIFRGLELPEGSVYPMAASL